MTVIKTDSRWPNEHLDEVAELLATGLQRLFLRKSSAKTGGCGESWLDILAEQSGHPEGSTSENVDER